MLSVLLDFLFPKKCLRCHNRGDYLCPSCLNFLPLVKTPVCPECLKSSPFGLTHPICHRSLDGLLCPFNYQSFIKSLITTYKYHHIRDYTSLITELILSYTDFSPLPTKPHLIIPVPLHPRKQRQRGFNQSALIAQSLAEALHWPYLPNLLIRHKFTQPQKNLNPHQRHQNLRHAFRLTTPLDLSGYSILLIDDIFTTGATLHHCARALKRTKPSSIWSLTICKTPHPSDRVISNGLL